MKREMIKLVSIAGFMMAAAVAQGESAPALTTPQPMAVPAPSPTAPMPTSANPSRKIVITHKVVPKLSVAVKSNSTALPRSAYEEARNLIVAQQKYLLKFEDEQSYGKLSESDKNQIEYTFSEEDVQNYQNAIEKIATYRNKMRSRCTGASPRVFTAAIDRYLSSLSMFNRKALPLVSDISENNPEMILVVNRDVLIDAPVLISRYLQFKKQRFKESMAKFSPSDVTLINAFSTVAKILKVDISDSDWNKNYGARKNGVEMISMWPRETIYEATDRLTEAKETVCIVDIRPVRDVRQASKNGGDRHEGTGE